MDNNQKNKSAKSGYLNAYKSTEIKTANREAILLMLYDGAIRFLKQAIKAIDEKNIEERNRLIGRTQDIVTELRATLNFNVSQEIATSLEMLYEFISNRLLIGNRDNDSKSLTEALNILITLRQTWDEAINSLKQANSVSK